MGEDAQRAPIQKIEMKSERNTAERLPRNEADADVRWFEFADDLAVQSFTMFHTIVAYEVDGAVVLSGCRQNEFGLEVYGNHSLDRISFPKLWRFELDLGAGTVSVRQVSTATGEFPVVHPRTIASPFPARFGYLSLSDRDERFHGAVMNGVAKFDLAAEAEVGRIDFGEGKWAGETIFVPAAADGSGPEDAGFLLSLVCDDATATTALHIFDAQTMSARRPSPRYT